MNTQSTEMAEIITGKYEPGVNDYFITLVAASPILLMGTLLKWNIFFSISFIADMSRGDGFCAVVLWCG